MFEHLYFYRCRVGGYRGGEGGVGVLPDSLSHAIYTLAIRFRWFSDSRIPIRMRPSEHVRTPDIVHTIGIADATGLIRRLTAPTLFTDMRRTDGRAAERAGRRTAGRPSIRTGKRAGWWTSERAEWWVDGRAIGRTVGRPGGRTVGCDWEGGRGGGGGYVVGR